MCTWLTRSVKSWTQNSCVLVSKPKLSNVIMHPPSKKISLNKDLYFDEEIFFYVKKEPSTIKVTFDFYDNEKFILMHPQTWLMYTLKNVVEKHKCKC
jgi:hypothetical protein